MSTHKSPRTQRFFRILSSSLLILWTVAVLYPLLWTGLGALKDNRQFMMSKPWALPELPLLWSNYRDVWNQYHFGGYFMNSVVVTVLSSFWQYCCRPQRLMF
jgi:N-acetylglucosamine transport system permease protein